MGVLNIICAIVLILASIAVIALVLSLIHI